MSFILDALRKSEHERQRAAVPGLAQVPLAAPEPQLPRWALGLIAVLAAALLVLGAAWWQSSRAPSAVATAGPPPPTVERNVALPPLAVSSAAPTQAAPSRPLAEQVAAQDAPSLTAVAPKTSVETTSPSLPPRTVTLGNDTRPEDLEARPEGLDLPSAASLAAAGVAVPPLRLELHAYSAQAADRFVFINGRKYKEGERLAEGPVLVSIEPTGAVLTHAGRRFMLVQD